ncbi:MlaD family protein [Plesiocystis pacifica]|uniref:MlaD family protein n=1 Tax=Plesiocystis pacifica TaxID=191768 RepID=UPI0012F79833|nr:MlaD family protein [Plesiocystis pacifica]
MHPRLSCVLALATLGAAACVDPPRRVDELDGPAMLPEIALANAEGLEPGTPVWALGVHVGTVESLQVRANAVIVHARAEGEHDPGFAADACAVVEDGALKLELGGRVGEPFDALEGPLPPCSQAAPEATPKPEPEPEPEPEPIAKLEPGEVEPIPVEADDPGPTPGPGAQPGTPPAAKPPVIQSERCGDGLGWTVLAYTAVNPQPLHLPEGGWRAKIRFTNDSGIFVEMDAVDTAAFMDPQGGVLDVATLPGSKDWFMPFSLPAHANKTVTVTFHADGDDPPDLHRVRYSYRCG